MKRRVYWTADFSPLEILGRRVRTKVRGPVHAHVTRHAPVSILSP
jgi:hypothetical protein